MGEREQQRARLEKAFANRDLIWFGAYGIDAGPLLQFSGLRAVYSLVCPLNSARVQEEICLEELEGVRDTSRFDLDGPPSPELAELRSALGAALSTPSVLFANRPSRFPISCVIPIWQLLSTSACHMSSISSSNRKTG